MQADSVLAKDCFLVQRWWHPLSQESKFRRSTSCPNHLPSKPPPPEIMNLGGCSDQGWNSSTFITDSLYLASLGSQYISAILDLILPKNIYTKVFVTNILEITFFLK